MKYKYQSLLIKDSMRRHASSETVMLYRLFVQEDKTNIEREKADVQNGKILDVPSGLVHRTSDETLPPDTPYPWELEWEKQKIYKFEPWQNEEEEEEGEEHQENEKENGSTKVKEQDKLKEKRNEDEKVDKEEDEEEEDVVVEEEKTAAKEEKEESVRNCQEKDNVEKEEEEEEEGVATKEEESCKDYVRVNNEENDLNEFDDDQETCLQIFMKDEDEEEDDDKTKEDDREKTPPITKLNCNDLKSDSDNADERSSKKESEPEEELVICDKPVSNSIENSPVDNEVAVVGYPREMWINCGENVISRLSDQSQSPDIPRTPSNISNPITLSSNCETSENNFYKQTHSPSLRIVTDRTDKDKRREKVEKDYKKKADRGKDKDKERGKDREKEDRPPKKLKIKPLVPPLRIRTDERSIGLKLTLKKEGSGAYYSVGEERKREYRVEQNEDEEDDEELDDIVGRQFDGEEDEEEEDGDGDGHGLKEVKVVLQDVLKDKRFKKQIEERSSKKRRREKGDDRNDKNEKIDRNDRHNSHWSSYTQQLNQSEGDKKNSQSSNHENRTWNHNSGMEWRRSGGEGASSIDNSSDHRTREYSPRLYAYNDHYGHEYSNRHNHSQPYGHSGSQPRNSHSYY